MIDVDDRVRPGVEPERGSTLVGADAEQRVDGDHTARPRLPACDSFQLAQLLERIDADVRVRADAHADLAVHDACDGQEAVAEIRLRRRADADARAGIAQQVELGAVGMSRMHDRRARAEATLPREQFDRADAVLGEALVDLTWLFVGVHVERQVVLGRVAAELAQRIGGACAHRVGGDPHADAGGAQLFELEQVRRHGLLAEPWAAPAQVAGVQADELDPGLCSRLGGRARLVEAEIVELAHRRVPVRAQLPVHLEVLAADLGGGQPLRQGDHPVAPGPEVATRSAPPQGPLKRVTVGIDEPRYGQHRHILSSMTRAQLPNALTIARFFLIPVYVALIVSCDGGRSWPAAIVFGVAGVTDQVDGFLARRWQVESAFGKFADPLADRLMIDAAVILLIHAGRLPWLALIIPARDLVTLIGTPIVLGRGYEFQVNLIGKAATWLLYAALGFVMVTHAGATWPLWVFWSGLALALIALGEYALKVRREVLA